MPKELEEDILSQSLSMDLSMFKKGKIEITNSVLLEKEKYVAKTNWLNEMELECIIDYNSKKLMTVCRIKDGELQFEGGSAFRLSKITKMQVLFEKYKKVICFTYDDMKGKKSN